MWRIFLVVVALSGCNALLGIHDLPAGTTGGETGTGTFVWDYVIAGSNGPIAMEAPAPAAGESLSLGLEDLSTQPITLAADGSFGFAFTGDPYRLLAQDDDGSTLEYQAASASVLLRRAFADRIDRAAVGVSTPIEYHISAVPGGVVRIASTGIRSFSFPDSYTATDTQLDWLHASIADGTLGLLDGSAGDRLYWLHFLQSGSNPYLTVGELQIQSVTMTAGMPTEITATTSSPAQDKCVHILTPRSTELARVESITGISDPVPATSWALSATPIASYGPIGLLPLANNTAQTVDEDQQVQFTAPYTGESTIASMTVLVHQTFTAAGAMPSAAVEVGATYYDVVTPAMAPCPTPAVMLGEQPIALVTAATLSGVDLITGIQILMFDRSKVVPLQLTLGQGAVDDVAVTLYEVDVSSANVTTLHQIRTFVTAGTSLAIDPTLLVSGRSYVLDFETLVGAHQASQGDFRHLEYPQATGHIYSRAFVIF